MVKSVGKMPGLSDAVANKLHAERQAYLNSANGVGSNRGGVSGSRPGVVGAALAAISHPLVAALRALRVAGTHTTQRFQRSPSNRVVPHASSAQSPALFPGVDPASAHHSSSHFALESPAGFRPHRGVRSPGEEKSDSPLPFQQSSPHLSSHNGQIASAVRTRPNLRLDESALFMPPVSAENSAVRRATRAAARALASGLHQSIQVPSPPVLHRSSTSATHPVSEMSSAEPSPVIEVVATADSVATTAQSALVSPSVAPPVSPGTPLRLNDRLLAGSQVPETAIRANPQPVLEDAPLSCCCGLDLLLSRLVFDGSNFK